ncbi:MAG: BatD family protein, partial [Oligoflexales bacterium]|nr:BatD family protein [Oligoflexales bacterium]
MKQSQRLKIINTWLFILLAWIISDASAIAGEFSAQLNRQQIQVGEDVQLTLTIQGSYSGEPELPDVPGLNVQSTSTSQSVSIINGSMSKQVEFIYILVAEREGTFVIPSLSMKVDGEVLKSPELTLQVKQANNSVQDDASGEPPLLFIEREFSKSSVYVNEPFISTVKIFYRVELAEANPQLSEPPEFKAIALEQQNKYRSQVKGYDYHVVELNRIYIPLKAGTFELSPFKLNATLIVPGSRNQRSTDPFDF